LLLRKQKKNKVYVTPELLFYGLISQPNSIAAKLISTTISEFRNNKSLTSTLISQRIYDLNIKKINEKFSPDNKLNKFSQDLWDENASTPWLSPDVKEIFKKSFKMTLQSKKKVTIISSKLILFELLSKEFIRELLLQVIH